MKAVIFLWQHIPGFASNLHCFVIKIQHVYVVLTYRTQLTLFHALTLLVGDGKGVRLVEISHHQSPNILLSQAYVEDQA